MRRIVRPVVVALTAAVMVAASPPAHAQTGTAGTFFFTAVWVTTGPVYAFDSDFGGELGQYCAAVVIEDDTLHIGNRWQGADVAGTTCRVSSQGVITGVAVPWCVVSSGRGSLDGMAGTVGPTWDMPAGMEIVWPAAVGTTIDFLVLYQGQPVGSGTFQLTGNALTSCEGTVTGFFTFEIP